MVFVVCFGVFFEGLEESDHLVIDLLGSGQVARIAGLVDRTELRRKVLRGEVDLLPERSTVSTKDRHRSGRVVLVVSSSIQPGKEIQSL